MDLASRLAALEEVAGAAYARWEHLQQAFPDPRGVGYWTWLGTHGTREIQGVAELFPPVPPAEIYSRSNTTDDWGYLLTAATTYRMVTAILADHGPAIEDCEDVLDFGCGPGRGLRLFMKHALKTRFAGTDVDEAAIAWCRDAFFFGSFAVNGELPPTVYEDDRFDVVFAVSVFSHLSERSQAAWLEEIRRVLKPGGIAILTVHGLHALERAVTDARMFAMIEVDPELFEAAREIVLRDHGFGFIPQSAGHLTRDLYGVAFMHPDHVRARWTEGFELLEHRVAAIDDWQDAVVIRKR